MEVEIEKERVRADEAENERKRMELEDAKSRREHEWRMAQINRPDRYQGDDGIGENGGIAETGVLDMRGDIRRQSGADTLVNQVKRYGIALKQLVTPMPSDASEVPRFFENLEAMFRVFEVPEDLQAKLLLPFLSVKAKDMISQLCASELEDYNAVRDVILAEFKLTPREYKTRFDSATKESDKTYTMFTARLRCNLRYYVRSRACMDDFDGLFALLVADKLKSCLSEGALDYVLALEGRDCFGPRKIAELADTYVSNHGERNKARCTVHVAQVRGSARDRSPRTDRWQGCTDRSQDGDREMQPACDVTCFLCNEKGHVVKFCPKKGTRESRPSAKPAQAEQRPSGGVRRCYVCNSSRHLVRDCPNRVNKLHDTSDTEDEEAQVNVCFGNGDLMIDCDVMRNCQSVESDGCVPVCKSGHEEEFKGTVTMPWEFGEHPQVEALVANCRDKNGTGVKLSSLKYVNVQVNDVNCIALVDSGAEIGVLSEAVAEKLKVETCGHINIRGMFSDPKQVPLVNVEVKMCGDAICENVADGMPVVCAIAPFEEVTHDAVLPIDVVTDLQNLPEMNDTSVSVFSSDLNGVVVEETCDECNDDDVVLDADQLPVGGCVSDGTDVKQLEERDDSLSAFLEVAMAGEGYLAARIGECVRFLCHLVWLVCCIWSFCVFTYGSQWGGATAENEAIVWAFSQSGGTVCGYQDAMVCRYNLCSMCVKFVSDGISVFIFS